MVLAVLLDLFRTLVPSPRYISDIFETALSLSLLSLRVWEMLKFLFFLRNIFSLRVLSLGRGSLFVMS